MAVLQNARAALPPEFASKFQNMRKNPSPRELNGAKKQRIFIYFIYSILSLFIFFLFLGKTTLNRSTNSAQQSIVKRRVCILNDYLNYYSNFDLF